VLGCCCRVCPSVQIPDLVQGQLALSVESHMGRVLDCTGVQTPGVLDDVFYTDEPLGDHYCRDTQTHRISVWVSAYQVHWSAAPGWRQLVHAVVACVDRQWSQSVSVCATHASLVPAGG
jgi:hypothetical protein